MAIPEITRPAETPETVGFEPKSDQELLIGILVAANEAGFPIEHLDYQQQPGFTHIVHSRLNKYYRDRHQHEWGTGVDKAIAPPLPLQWVSSRIDTYYSSVNKSSKDQVLQNTILKLRKEHLPTALKYVVPLPEIASAVEIQAMLDEAGHDLAADAVGDLLVVYGITLYYLREKSAKKAQLQKEIARRATENLAKLER